MFKSNHFLTGFISGLLAPFVGFYLFYLAQFRAVGLEGYYNQLLENNKLAAAISLSLVANLALFFVFDRFGYLFAQRGVIAATFLYGFFIVYLKFF
jgi:hypothetical protein